MPENAVAKRDEVMSIVKNLEDGVGQALPTHVAKDAFMRALQTCLRKNQKLPQCDMKSLGSSVMDSAQVGLTLGYTGHLVPFNVKGQMTCTLIIDYKGLIDMAYRNERVLKIMSDVICEKDKFEYNGFGKPVHNRDLMTRGKALAAYAYCELKGCDDPIVVVLCNEEIEKVRASSRAGTSGPWVDWWGEMAKKTAIKRLCKIIPKSIELQSALEYEDRTEQEAREVQAAVVEEDVMQPGRHDTRRKAAKPSDEPTEAEQAAADAKRAEIKAKLGGKGDGTLPGMDADGGPGEKDAEAPRAYQILSRAYDTEKNQKLVDECLSACDLPPLPDCDWSTFGGASLDKLDKAAALYAKKIKA